MKNFNTISNQLTAMPKRLAMVLTMLLIVGIGQMWGAEEAVTISFANANQRVSQTSSQQVWKNGDVTFTNDKGASTSDVVNNTNPVRLYANSSITITAPGNIKKIVATASSSNYATALKNSITSGATISGSVVTIIPSTSSTSYNIAKLSAQVRLSSIAITYEVAASCDKKVTINKGSENNGKFTLDKFGEQETCDGLTILVTPTPNNHYSVGSVTATTPTTGGAPTITDNGNDTWSVTYAANSTGSSTINVAFKEAPGTTSTLSEAGSTRNPSGTFYVGDSYTLPSSTAECGDKTFVGWSTVTIDNSAGKPASNFYERGASVTLGAINTFYAVFAETGGTPTTTWPKTDIANIKSTDEVVITMSNGVTTWALRNDYGTSAPPYAESIPITNEQISSKVGDVQIWNISNSSGNLTIYPKGKTTTWLYCTDTNNGVRVGTNANKTFTISGNYLQHTTTDRYIGVYTTNPDWRCYDNTTSNIAGQTLAFYKKTTTSGYQNYTTECSTPTKFTVSFDPNGHGTAPEEQTVTSGEYAQEPDDDPTETGYKFQGWYNNPLCTGEPFDFENTPITADITLYAKWEAIQNTITLNPNGGSGNTASVKATYDSSTLNPSSITNPTKTGHTFGGWYSGEGGTGSLVINTSGKLQANVSGYTGANGVWKATTNKKLYAKWTPAVYAINYKDQGGANFSGQHEAGYPQNHTYNTATTLKSASKEHYAFDGWYKESDCSGTKVTTLGATEYTDNITLYAKWTANTYTITFNAGTGECGTESVTTTNASGVTLPTATHTCTDWDFAGWAETSVTERTTAPTLLAAGDNYKPTSAITLYAVYSKTETTQGGGENIESSAIISWSESTLSFSGNGWNSNTSKGYSGNYLRLDENQQYVSYSASTGTVSQIKFTYKLQSSTACTGHKDQAWWIGEIELYGSINSGSSWSKIDSKCISVNSGDNLGKDISVTYNDLSSEGYNAIKIQFAKECGNLAIKGLSATSGGGSTTTTTYNSNPTCLVPVWNGADIDKTALTVNCGERSPMEGANGAAQITFNKDKIYNFSSDITITASEGFLVSTS